MKNKKIVTIERMKSGDAFCAYPGQSSHQPCFLELTENGTARIRYDAEIGNGVPESVWHGRTRRWWLPFPISAKSGNKLMRDLLPFLERIVSGSESYFDGNNFRMRRDDAAQEAIFEVEREIENTTFSYCPQFEKWAQ